MILKLKIRFITWFHSLFPGRYCWADCVAWAYSNKWNPFKIMRSRPCEIDSLDNKSCYCGSWQDGKCWNNLSKEEKEIFSQQGEVTEGMPF